MGSLLNGFLGGIYGYIAAFVVGLSLAAGATYYVVHNANAVEIGNLQLAAKTKEASDVTHSLAQLQGFIAGIRSSQTNYQATLDGINAALIRLRGQWAAAAAGKPLPKDCLPDAARVRAVNDAIRAVNNPTATP